MRKQLLIGAGMCFVAVALIFAGSARAEPPEAMAYVQLPVPVIACDSKEEMGTVVQAVKDGNLKEKLVELMAIKDDHGESVCIYSQIGPIVFGYSEHIGRLIVGEQTLDTWVSNVGNRHAGFYILYAEVVKDTPA